MMHIQYMTLHELGSLASLNVFSIHDVPYEGNCMFSAIYQLQSTSVCDVNSDGLRQIVADYLEAPSTYCDAVSHSWPHMMLTMQTHEFLLLKINS